ncbi:peptide-methionine (S)-S-oxide reductase [Sphingobacterium sp. T2]|uniref:peptide-methionine (S)-S-oxide reductase n=1 Tax=Sphingobacterium sp. T2 TaxID=1590596 RepID=UPI0021CE0282|nr:peptide-methionine (S)-S-oxide reductase [Sphingobacterium sp. T2]
MENKEVAILAGGCFWCVEAPLLLLEGVDTVVSGYSRRACGKSHLCSGMYRPDRTRRSRKSYFRPTENYI